MALRSDVGLTAMPLSWGRKCTSGCGFFVWTARDGEEDGKRQAGASTGSLEHNKDNGNNDDQ